MAKKWTPTTFNKNRTLYTSHFFRYTCSTAQASKMVKITWSSNQTLEWEIWWFNWRNVAWLLNISETADLLRFTPQPSLWFTENSLKNYDYQRNLRARNCHILMHWQQAEKMILLLVKGLFNSPWMIVLHNSEEWNSSHSCVIVFARSTVHVMWHVVPFLLFLWQSSVLEWSAAVCRVLDYLTRCNYSVSLPVFVWYGHCNPMQL